MQLNKSILVVDDTQMNRKLISNLLRKENIDVFEAASAEEALELTSRTKFDIIFMDVNLPGLNGIQATRRIRSNDQSLSQNSMIIGISAHASEVDRKAFAAAGMDGCLPKPIDINDLVAITRNNQKPPAEFTPVQPVHEASDTLGSAISVLDTEAALARIGSNTSLYKRFVQIFRSDVHPLIVNAESLAENDNTDALQKLAHRIRGMSSNLAAHEVTSIAQEIENQCATGKQSTLPKLVRQLADAVERLESEFVKQGLVQ